MLKNYFRTALRNILRNKKISFINIIGLSLSMSVCMLIIVIIQDQYSYDKMHHKGNSIFRVQSIDNKSSYALRKYASTTWPLAAELKNNYPFVEELVLVNNSFGGEAKYNDILLQISGLYTDAAFFRVFDFDLIRGSEERVLEEPFSIVMREDIARKYFGDDDPIGKTITIEDYGTLTVTGIIRESKEKSHIQFQALVSASTVEVVARQNNRSDLTKNWENYYSSYIYMIPTPGADMEAIQAAFDRITEEKYRDNEKVNVSFYLYSFNKIVPGPILGNELGLSMPRVYLLFFAGLGLVIIISAAFNYTSLSIARSLTRVREFGLRKTVGASRKQVISQILIEALLISFISLLIGIAILQLILPAFRGMKLMSLMEVSPSQNYVVFIWFLIFSMLTGLLAGILPALYVSRVDPVTVLKGSSNIKLLKRVAFRKVLLVIQYTFSMIFIITIILIYRQMIYMTNAEMGFNRELVYNIQLNGKKIDLIKESFGGIPGVVSIAGSSHVPGVGYLNDLKVKTGEDGEEYDSHYFSVDNNYISTMGLKLVAGGDFPERAGSDNEIFAIISELAVDNYKLGTPSEAVGKDLIIDDTISLRVIGVVENYKYAALFLPVRPLVLRNNPSGFRVAALRLESANLPATIDRIEAEWKVLDEVHLLEGMRLDDEIRDYYSIFEDIVYTVGFVTFISIVIACLGLLGMASYSTQTRSREMGIRKVFGAHRNDVLKLVSWSSLIMLLIASLIAAPLALLMNNAWLEFIPDHAAFGIGTVIVGILLVVVSSLLIIASQTIRVTKTNPAAILTEGN